MDPRSPTRISETRPLASVGRSGGRASASPLRLAAPAIIATAVLIIGADRAAAQRPPSGTQAPPTVVVGGVDIRGNDRLAEAVIATDAGIRAGDTITYREVQNAIRRLWASGQYKDIQVYARPDDAAPAAPVTVVIQVEEQPHIGSIEFRGLEHVGAGTIRDTVGLQAGRPLRPSHVAAAEAMIGELLAAEGIRLRDVQHRVEPIAGRPGENRLIFDVEEGQRVAIAQVEFEGNEAFSDGRLREAMNTKPEGFLWFRDGLYREDRLRADLRESLPAFYGRHGYIDFAVAGDSLVVDPQTGKGRLIIRVREGPRYRLASFGVQGNERFATADLKEYFETQGSGLLSGLGFGGNDDGAEDGTQYFDREAFAAATEQVRQAYNNQGYLYAQIEPVVERLDTEDGTAAVRVAWRIQENNPAYVNRVAIEGNTRTHESVIRAEVMILPGDVYSERALLQSYRRIAGLGFFATPMPTPEIERTENGDVNITFKVEERQTGSVNFGTSIGGWQGVSGFLGYDEPNLFGQAKAGHLRWEFGKYVRNFEARYSDPGIMGSRVSGSASLFRTHPRFYQFRGGSYRRTGGSLRFGLPLPIDRWSRVSLGYSLSRTDYEPGAGEDPSDNVFAQLRSGVLSTVSLGLTRGTLNHPIFPTEGTRQQVLAEFSGGPLGGDGDFQKYTVSGNWWVPVGDVGGSSPGSRPIQFALGLSLDAGALFGERTSLDRFPFERFFMGGVQYGQVLRGYQENTITPSGYIPDGAPGVSLTQRLGDAFLKLTAEYAVRFNDNLSVSLFYDAGNVWANPQAIDPTRLFRGAGIGVTLVTPFGPLGLDYAYGFDKDESPWELHFKFGQAF